MSDNNNNSKKKSKGKALLFSVIIFLLVLIIGICLAGYFWLKTNYNQKIYPNITIANQPVGNQTQKQAKQIVLNYINEIDHAGPAISYKTQILNPKFSQLGVSFNIDQAVEEAYNFGRTGKVYDQLKQIYNLRSQKNFSLEPVIEEKILAQYYDFVSATVNIPAKNSTIIYTDGQFLTTDSKAGVGLDQKDFDRKIKAFINGGPTKLELKTGTLLPTINPDDTTEAISIAKKYLNAAPIQIKFEDKIYSADQAEIARWISFNEKDGQLIASIADEKLNQFIDPIAKSIEINKVDREVVIGSGKVLNEGSDGRGVDKDKLLSDIKSAITNESKNTTISVNTFFIGRGNKEVAAVFVPEEYTGRYIDVNLTEQVLRLYDNKTIVNEYQVSTGKWSMPTPVGVRYIENKSEMAWSNKYQLYMPWWNSIGGGYGIHELPMWPNGYHEGEGHLGTPVSHGCIRLGIGPAQFVYNWAPVGTPVNIHK